MTNIYWPVYKNLESELLRLSYSIHIDDVQLKVYSSKITDLILRAVAEIESISKELYKLNGGTKTSHIKFDLDAIKHLNSLWTLENKVVIISSQNCFQTNRVLKPFVKNVPRTGSNRMTFSWNNAYQNLKHDRGNSLSFGSVRYLFDAMAALFILNTYYKNEIIDLGNDASASNFPIGLGSNVFSVQLHKYMSLTKAGYVKKPDFIECLYTTKATDTTAQKYFKSIDKINQEVSTKTSARIGSRIQSEIQRANGAKINIGQVIEDEKRKIGHSIMMQVSRSHAKDFMQLRYEAVLNKNQI